MGSFSSKPTPSAPPPKASNASISPIDRAVLDLKNSRDRLQRYRSKLETDEVKLMERARLAKTQGKKQQALGLLRLRNYKRTQLQAVEEQLLTVLTLVETIDSKQNESQVLQAMKSGKDALNKMHQERTIDDVLDLMDGIAESVETEQEINTILNKAVPALSAEDELAVEQELIDLESELNPQQDVSLPTAPTTKLPEQKPAEKKPEAAQRQPERVAVPG